MKQITNINVIFSNFNLSFDDFDSKHKMIKSGKEYNISRLFFIQSFLFILITVLLLGFFWINSTIKKYSSEARSIQNEFIESQKEIIKRETNKAVDFIQYNVELSQESLRTLLKERVYRAHAIATNLYDQYSNKKSKEEIGNLIKEALRPIRFNDNRGYYFIGDLNGYDILYPPAPQFEGKYLYNLKDDIGNLVMQEEMRIVKNYGEGFTIGYWNKPGEPDSLSYKKLSFVKLFKPLNWYIGTGEYIDSYTKDIQESVINRLSKIRFEEEGYIFVNTFDGKPLITDGEVVKKDTNLWNLTDKNGVRVIQEERRASKNPDGDYIFYAWKKLSNDSVAQKISFVKGVNEWRWMVGAGVYLDSVNSALAAIRNDLNKTIKKNVITILALLFVILAGSYFIILLLSRKLKKNINQLISIFENASSELWKIESTGFLFKEFNMLAQSANNMIDTIKKNEQEKEQSENYFKKLFESAPVAIAILNNDGNIQKCNKKFTLLFQYSLDEMQNKNLDEFIVPKELHEEAIYSTEQLQKGMDVTLETIRKAKTGESIDVNIKATPIIINNKQQGIYVLYQDIRGIKAAERELFEAKQKAEESDRLKSSFLGNISHEIRTPMNAIIGFTNLLNDKDLEKQTKEEYIKIINKSSNSLLNVIDNIIDVAKLEAEQLSINKIDFDIHNILYNLLDLFISIKNQQGQNNVELKLRKEIKEPKLIIHSDPIRIKQILNNLLDNAIKFTSEGIIEFGYELDNTKIKFFVKDTGIGMNDDIKEVIFDSFRRNEMSLTKKYSGTGLGLTISKKLTELLGGEIWFESIPKKGTNFYFSIPLSNQESKISTRSNVSEGALLNLSSQKILIAEDVETNFQFLESALKPTKVKIYWAKNGIEAVQITDKIEPDLILMDIHMPRMNGHLAFKEIKKKHPEIPIIAQTAYAMDHEISEILQLQYQDYLVKPIELKLLYNKLSKYLT